MRKWWKVYAKTSVDNLTKNLCKSHDKWSQQLAKMGANLYKIRSIPQTFLIGRDGKIIDIGLRGSQLESRLKEIFNIWKH